MDYNSNQNSSDDYYLKYLKYKKKYLQLKYKQKGGVKFNVVPNNGAIEEFTEEGELFQMSNQCMWISLRDYFINVLPDSGINTVIQLKRLAELDLKSTLHTQFDWETLEFREGIEIIAGIYDLRIEAYLVNSNGDSHPNLKHKNGSDMPMHIINERGRNIVKIAFYGSHFQLITDNLNVFESKPIKSEPIIPKIFSTKTMKYENISDDEIMIYYKELIDFKNIYDINKKNIINEQATYDLIQKDISYKKEEILTLKETLTFDNPNYNDIDPNQKTELDSIVINQIEELVKEQDELQKKNQEITNNIVNLISTNEILKLQISELELQISELES